MCKSSSYCGVNCSKCPIFIATKENSDILKSELAIKWGEMYNKEFTLSDIHCEGCKSEHRFVMCSQCNIEVCNTTKDNDSCYDCSEYQCIRIRRFEETLKRADLYYV